MDLDRLVSNHAGQPLAGVSALAQATQLAGPPLPCLAASREKLRDLGPFQITALPRPDRADALVQVWRYDPMRLAADGVVDPLSLYLSLKDDDDERVGSALDDLMGKLPWWKASTRSASGSPTMPNTMC